MLIMFATARGREENNRWCLCSSYNYHSLGRVEPLLFLRFGLVSGGMEIIFVDCNALKGGQATIL